MKYIGTWRWENQCIVYSLVALLIVPWTIGFASVPGFLQVIRNLPLSVLAAPFLFGIAWGIGGTCFGISMPMVGMAIAYSVDLGLMTAIGSMTPLVVSNRAILGTSQGIMIQSAVVLVLIGVIFTAVAGKAREGSGKKASAQVSKKTFWAGLVFAILAGVFSPSSILPSPLATRSSKRQWHPALPRR